jgi:3',5'-cyclic AMP phosphodiesterase CpdA
MRKLVHLSDIHFGRLDVAVLPVVRDAIQAIGPDVTIVSGDLTQRARTEEFEQARDFLASLPTPQIVVPGNHDVPLHNVYARFHVPLNQYRRFITEDLEPFHSDDEIAILGINTARSLVFKNGRVNARQIATIEDRFCACKHVVKILVTHHPFDLPSDYSHRDLVGRARQAMAGIARCKIDLLLAGHYHVSHTGSTAVRYDTPGHSAIFVQAGTLSTRGRGEPNSMNRIEIDRNHIKIERLTLLPGDDRFHSQSCEEFRCAGGEWISTHTEVP